jgi:hypothetical protein
LTGLADHFWPIIKEIPERSDASSYGRDRGESTNQARALSAFLRGAASPTYDKNEFPFSRADFA